MLINLRDYYPFYHQDVFVDVDERIIEQFKAWERVENRRRRTMMRHNAYYTLDYDDCAVHLVSCATEEALERKLSNEELYTAMAKLPENQARRIYALYFLGMSVTEIARAENVSKPAITSSIQRGMKALLREINKLSEEGVNN